MKSNEQVVLIGSNAKDEPAPSPEKAKFSQKIFSQLISKSLPSQQSPQVKGLSQRLSESPNTPKQNLGLSGSKVRQSRNTLTPGFTENKSENRSFSPSYSIGKSERFSTALSTPGPGCYDLSKLSEKSPAYSIGKADRVLLGDQVERLAKTPGPADYSPEKRIHSPSAYLLGKSSLKPEIRPGPADYNTDKAKLYPKAAEYTIGKSTRQDIVRNNYPGPSSYNTQNAKKSVSVSFSKSSRSIRFTSDSPGPNFVPPSTLSTNGGVIGIRTNRKESDSPGPGHYSAKDLSPSKSFSFKKSPRYLPKQPSEPSPASYSPVELKTSLGFRFTRSVRKDLFGSHSNLNSTTTNASLLTPGPGTYSPKFQNSSPRFTIPKSSRESRIETSPGPGDYNVRKSLEKSYNPRVQTRESETSNFKFVEYAEHSTPEVRKNNYENIRKIRLN